MRNKVCLAGLVLALALLSSCQRDATPDQPWDGPSGFEYIVEGWAIPSTIYLPEFNATQIKVRATRADGTPLAGAEIIFKHWSIWGVFDSGTTSVGRYTNANGEAWATFVVTLIANGTAYVDVSLINNSRTEAYDEIPITIYTE